MAKPKSNMPVYLGLAAAGGVGYYLYSAGGDAKVAKKQAEADVASLSSKVKGELPGKEKEYKKEGELWGQKAGSKLDSAVADGKAKLEETEAKLEQYRKDVGKDLNQKIDQFDKKVEEGTAKAKSGISSWFGGK